MARTKLNPDRALLTADWAFTGGITLDSTTLVIDDVNNRVGIGTAAPANTLDVDGDVSISGLFGIGISTPGASIHIIGIDSSSNPSLLVDVGTGSSDIILMKDNGSSVASIDNEGRFRADDGTIAAPGFAFFNDTANGIVRNASNNWALVVDGSIKIGLATTSIEIAENIIANPDNTHSLGAGSFRFTDVFAASGSVNTSHSSTKYDIKPLEDLPVPEPVRFKRKDEVSYRTGKEYIGYINDDLPDAARAMTKEGLDEKGNYENAVVGILCKAVRKLQAEVKTLKRE